MLRDPGEGSSTMVTEQVVFNSVYLEGDTAYVDFKSVGPSSGSMGEGFLISQIVNTLLDFDEVKQVQFLVNGEVAETLMGHVGTAEPFTEDVY
jgi:spore germination protein GerM